MRFATDLASCSWTVPVPVKRSRFAALDPSHDVHNVETDLAAIRAFSLDAEPPQPPPELLHADLQTVPMWTALRRLGSGRAGVHRGAYLKGIGRTPLAANWADHDDRYHNTGHMLPSAAAREYVVSRALDALGLTSSICPCTGLLAAELERPADDFLASIWPDATERFAMADRRMQAISVKPANFARLSNFVWALDHIGAPVELAELFHRLHVYLCPPDARPSAPASTSPAALAAALAAAVERGIANFRSYLHAGVFWGSLSNNLTADGRFLDLEVPMVLLRPFFGVVTEGGSGRTSSNWFGLEVLAYVQETRAFVTALRERIRFLANHAFTRGVMHDFLAELARELDERLPVEHILWSRARLEDTATTAIVEELGLDRGRAAGVRALVARQAAVIFDDARADWSDVRMRRLDLRIAAPEPGQERACAYPEFLADACTGDLDAGRAFNDGLRVIDASTGVAQLFERIGATTRHLDVLLAPAPARRALP